MKDPNRKEKVCITCNKLKNITEYHIHLKNIDGHRNDCIECNNTKNRKRYHDKIKLGIPVRSEQSFLRAEIYHNSEEYKIRKRKYDDLYRRTHPVLGVDMKTVNILY